MKPEYTKFGPKFDYRGAQCQTSDGKLWDIIDVYYREFPGPSTIALCRSFNREIEVEIPLFLLDILEGRNEGEKIAK